MWATRTWADGDEDRVRVRVERVYGRDAVRCPECGEWVYCKYHPQTEASWAYTSFACASGHMAYTAVAD